MPSYDMIIGMDWLATHSLMHIDWQHKWVWIPYGQSTVRLQGKLRELPAGSVIQVTTLSSNDRVQQESVP